MIDVKTTRSEFPMQFEVTVSEGGGKTRHRVPEGSGAARRVWEIDVFEGFDLVLAEVELPAPDARVEPPAWLADHIVREVTDDRAYRNFALAVNAGVRSAISNRVVPPRSRER